jgi:hypothetical protein
MMSTDIILGSVYGYTAAWGGVGGETYSWSSGKSLDLQVWYTLESAQSSRPI